MPELPDVEGFRMVVAEHAVGDTIRDVTVHDAGVLIDCTAKDLVKALRGKVIGEPWRHGKWLVLPVGVARPMLHFGMTGSMRWCARGEEPHPHDRVVFTVDGGELRYRDMRKLRGLRLAYNDEEVEENLSELGPDAAKITAAEFAELLGRRRRVLKAALLDQAVLAGLGNLLIDEILWQQRLSPSIRTDQLDKKAKRALHSTMRRVLRTSTRHRRVPPKPDWLTGARDSTRFRCPRCGTKLESGTVGGRTTVWCPRCQG